MKKTIRQQIKIGIILFIIITVITYIIISYLFLYNMPKSFDINIKYQNIIYAIILYLIFHLFNILRIHELLKVFTKSFSFYDASVFTLGGVFLATITPFQSGGIPLQLYLMKKRNVNVGHGISVLFIRGVQSFLVFIITIPFTFIFFAQLFDNSIVSALIKYFIFFYIAVMFFVFIFIFFPNILKKIPTSRYNWLNRLMGMLINHSDNFKHSFSIYVKKGKKHFFISCLYVFISMYSMFAMTYFIVLIFNGKDNFFLIFNIQLLLTYLLAFVPTPGSSGFAEGGGSVFYSMIIPRHNMVAFIFLWRLLSSYLPALIGMFMILKSFKFILDYNSTKGGDYETDIS